MEPTVDPILDDDEAAYHLLFLAANWSALFECWFGLPMEAPESQQESEAA